MKDEIIGVAVLDTSGPIQWLYYVRTSAFDGSPLCGELPVMSEGGQSPSVPLPSWFPENKPWLYSIDGDCLRVHPSVHIHGRFHNEGAWSVGFVLATGRTRADHYRQLVAANPALDLLRDAARRIEEE